MLLSEGGFNRDSFAEGAAEKIENITTNYGYWSDTELWKFDNVAGNSPRVPFDAHELVALVAPVRLCFLWSVAHIIDIFVVACDTLGLGQEDWWVSMQHA